MKIAVYGFGAVGGLIGARLAAMGCEVSAVALGVQDVVIVAVKATALADVAARVAPLIGPDTIVITAMNGVPWWFFAGDDLPYAGTQLKSLDPEGALPRAIPSRQVIGCVVHLSSSCPQPGLVRLGFGNRLILGEPAGGRSARVDALVALLQNAGFDAEASIDIRTDIWYKLWGNMTMNPVSAITGATGDQVLDDPLVRAFCLAAMQEAASIGAKIGCPIAQSGADRMEVTRKLGAFKTSMLQDAEAGKPLEIDALVTAVHEIGKLVGVPTPMIDGLLGLARLYGRTHGLYPKA
ncbi:MAG: 2-dehydropantoate 2-reductase [Noviherbaspirillum sp.]